ncbi:MAG: 4-hydroxy-tetrahydrodipicolinate reductase [Firmicutes bacterium]|nr:4-hydroxy-tetrahydrodipicolinate reductase [Bacillota bacterium]
MIKVVVTAPRGAMDSLIVQEAYKNENIQVVGCVGTPGRDYIGKDAGQVCGLGFDIGALVYDDIEADVDGVKLIDMCDVVADYSSIGLSMDVLAKCVAHGKAYLCGTTGFSEEELEEFEAAADKIPLMQTANTSYVVTVMKKLLRDAAKMLEGKAGMEIIEAHSDTKLDAPSGTAKELAQEMASGMSEHGYDDITFHSVRAGNTPSSHHVIFGCQGEMFQITHDAYDWRCYAIGACDAILYLGDRAAEGKAGSYSMFDVIEK